MLQQHDASALSFHLEVLAASFAGGCRSHSRKKVRPLLLAVLDQQSESKRSKESGARSDRQSRAGWALQLGSALYVVWSVERGPARSAFCEWQW